MIDLDQEPTFEEYIAARRVVLYEYEQLRKTGKHGKLNIASDEMVANIVIKSCERFRPSIDSIRGNGPSVGNVAPGPASLISGARRQRAAAR